MAKEFFDSNWLPRNIPSEYAQVIQPFDTFSSVEEFNANFLNPNYDPNATPESRHEYLPAKFKYCFALYFEEIDTTNH